MRTLNTICLLAFILLCYFGIVGMIWRHDTYYLSTATALLSFAAYLYGLYRPSIPGIASGLAMQAGLFGTVVGFGVMLVGVGNEQDILQMVAGANVAVHTTAVGLVCSAVLYVESVLLEKSE